MADHIPDPDANLVTLVLFRDRDDELLATVTKSLAAMLAAESEALKSRAIAETCRSAAAARRHELGTALIAARRLWPAPKLAQAGARGPGGRTWGEFLAAEHIPEASAWRYMTLAGQVHAEPEAEAEADPPILAAGHFTSVEVEAPEDNAGVAANILSGFDLRFGGAAELSEAGSVDTVMTVCPRSEKAWIADLSHLRGATADDERWTARQVEEFVRLWSPRCRGWMVVLTDHYLIPCWQASYLSARRVSFPPVPCVIRGLRGLGEGDGPSDWSLYAMVGRPRDLHWEGLPGAYFGGASGSAKHGAPKWLAAYLVDHYTKIGNLICDPFAAHGAMLIAALAARRRVVGAESNLKRFEAAYRAAAASEPAGPRGRGERAEPRPEPARAEPS